MFTPRSLLGTLLLLVSLLGGCAGGGPSTNYTPDSTGLRGHLLLIGGGLDDDNKPVYERFIALAKANAGTKPPHVVIATAASATEDPKGKTQSIHAYCPTCIVEVISRPTSREETVAIVDRANAMFFTGGDQKRITTRYLTPEGRDTPESEAMRRLLARGGVIAGTSAGDAMMSDPMFFTGRSAEALGIHSTRTKKAEDDDAEDKRTEIPLGPQIGKGMGFLPWAIADSHFYERHRFGRLVAALEQSGKRLGIGVGEDACVEIDLAKGEAIGVSVADSLCVDVGGVKREGLTRSNIRALVIKQGTQVFLPKRQVHKLAAAPAMPKTVEEIPVVEPGQNRQLASWRFFLAAQDTTKKSAAQLKLDGYDQTAWPDGSGWSVVEIRPQSATTTAAPKKP
jgi:cyanophycinase